MPPDYSKMTDAELMGGSNTDYSGMSDAELMAGYTPPAPEIPAAIEPSGFISANLQKGGQIAKQAVGGFMRFAGADRYGSEMMDAAKVRQTQLETANPSMVWDDEIGRAHV